MKPNGPAIGGGCVTRRQHPGRVPVPRASGIRKLSRCKPAWRQAGRVWRVFLPPDSYREWYNFYCMQAWSRYKLNRSRKFITGYKFSGGHWYSVAVGSVSETDIYHGCRILIGCNARVLVKLAFLISLGDRIKLQKP